MIYLKTFENFSDGKTIAYHGTPHGDFNEFSYEFRGSGADEHSWGDYGKGFYFSPHKKDAIAYAKGLEEKKLGDKPYLYTVELDMGRAFDMRALSEYQRLMNVLANKYGIFDIPEEELDKVYKQVGITREEREFMYDIESDMGDNWGDWDIAGKIGAEGYDSIINYDGSEYIVFKPEQIKILKKESLL